MFVWFYYTIKNTWRKNKLIRKWSIKNICIYQIFYLKLKVFKLNLQNNLYHLSWGFFLNVSKHFLSNKWYKVYLKSYFYICSLFYSMEYSAHVLIKINYNKLLIEYNFEKKNDFNNKYNYITTHKWKCFILKHNNSIITSISVVKNVAHFGHFSKMFCSLFGQEKLV